MSEISVVTVNLSSFNLNVRELTVRSALSNDYFISFLFDVLFWEFEPANKERTQTRTNKALVASMLSLFNILAVVVARRRSSSLSTRMLAQHETLSDTEDEDDDYDEDDSICMDHFPPPSLHLPPLLPPEPRDDERGAFYERKLPRDKRGLTGAMKIGMTAMMNAGILNDRHHQERRSQSVTSSTSSDGYPFPSAPSSRSQSRSSSLHSGRETLVDSSSDGLLQPASPGTQIRSLTKQNKKLQKNLHSMEIQYSELSGRHDQLQ